MAMLVPVPPAPPTGVLLLSGAAALLAGLLLLLIGRKANKVVLSLALAGTIGAGAGPLVAERINYANSLIVSLVLGVCVLILAFFLSRILWTILLAALLSVAAGAVFLAVNAAQLTGTPATLSGSYAQIDQWSLAVVGYAHGWLQALWDYNALALVLSVGAPVAIGIVVGIFWPRAMLIIITSLTGALLAVVGAGLVFWSTGTNQIAGWFEQPHLPGLVAAGLAAAGLIVQGRTYVIERKKKAKKPGPAQPEEKGSSGSPGK